MHAISGLGLRGGEGQPSSLVHSRTGQRGAQRTKRRSCGGDRVRARVGVRVRVGLRVRVRFRVRVMVRVRDRVRVRVRARVRVGCP